MFHQKKFIQKIALLAFLPCLLAGFNNRVQAQEKKAPDTKSETQEIIIRKKGDKDAVLKLEFTDDKVMVNGKPLVEFNNDEISINNRKIVINGKKLERDLSEAFDAFNFFNDDDFSGNAQSFSKAFLGVSTEADDNGAKIISVTENSAASLAGLQADDVITKIDDTQIDGPQALSKAILAHKPNDKIKVTYKRKGKTKSTEARLLSAPVNRTFSFSTPDRNFRSFTVPGRPINPRDFNFNFDENVEGFSFKKAQKLGIKISDIETGKGVKVVSVEEESLAAKAGLQAGDILISLNNEPIDNTDDARMVMHNNRLLETYPATVKRANKEMTFTIKVPKEIKTIDL